MTGRGFTRDHRSVATPDSSWKPHVPQAEIFPVSHVLLDEAPPASLLIRPNRDNPEVPKKPAPDLLEKVKASVKDPKAAAIRAMTLTLDRVLVAARWGCSSRNLDWTEAVAKLRGTVRTVEPNEWGGEDRTFSWIDGSCPKPAERDERAITVKTLFRFQEWSHGYRLDHANRYRYCYVTFEEMPA